MAGTAVYLETGNKRVFACAIHWPGWCRSGRSEEQALEALEAYGARYAVVAAEAGLSLTPEAARDLEVVERVPGSSTTDFGAPDKQAGGDGGPLSTGEAGRIADLLSAAWRVLDRVVARAPAELAKGPRGGGRDRDEVVRHILAAETAYARKIGVKRKEPVVGDAPAIGAHREAILEVLRLGAEVTLARGKAWPLRYAVRRTAWHVLDHAWEIEDRGGLTPDRAW